MAHGQARYRVNHDLLRERRELGGYTLRAFADACGEAGQGVSSGQLSYIERGVHQPRPALLKAMAKVLGISPKALTEQPVEADRLDGDSLEGVAA